MPGLALESIQIKNFKAIADSGVVRFTPLTLLIGENGSGKSSLIEALGTLQQIVIEDLDDAMAPWRGFDEVWHKGVSHITESNGRRDEFLSDPMVFKLRGRGIADDDRSHAYKAEVQLTRGLAEPRCPSPCRFRFCLMMVPPISQKWTWDGEIGADIGNKSADLQ